MLVFNFHATLCMFILNKATTCYAQKYLLNSFILCIFVVVHALRSLILLRFSYSLSERLACLAHILTLTFPVYV